jgi:hypothetical protein
MVKFHLGTVPTTFSGLCHEFFIYIFTIVNVAAFSLIICPISTYFYPHYSHQSAEARGGTYQDGGWPWRRGDQTGGPEV